MAVITNTFNVNGGNTGWTNQHVLDALEQALGASGAAHHSGNATSGAVRKLVAPSDGWDQVGGVVPIGTQSTPSRTKDYNYTSTGTRWNEWDYTDPSPPAGGSAMQVTVIRYGSDWSSNSQGKVKAIIIKNAGSGYANAASFTIPAANCGGTGASDIVFGTLSATVPEIRVWATKGGTINWWWSDTDPQINTSDSFGNKCKTGVCRVTNDASKALGTTYYTFTIKTPRTGEAGGIYMKSGPKWNDLEILADDGHGLFGYQGGYQGDPGMDNHGVPPLAAGSYPASDVSISAVDVDSTWNERRFGVYHSSTSDSSIGTDPQGYSYYNAYCRGQSPTDYPLRIVTYKSSNAQDAAYCIIQFQQIVSGNVEPYFCFSLNKGTQWGQNIWDLDHVFQGGITEYKNMGKDTPYATHIPEPSSTYKPSIAISTHDCITVHTDYTSKPNHYRGQYSNYLTRMRESLFGYDSSAASYYKGSSEKWDQYIFNIDGHQASEGEGSEDDSAKITCYYRNSNYDKVLVGSTTYQVHASADWHKPMKGLPICSSYFPCPYYIPDDFVIIQLVATPGVTYVRPGDTITVSGTEVYTVIEANGETNYSLFSNNGSIVSKWITFCARTT